jgi:2-hydroxy-6-oxonona-2,4-dienedioate hydrolase
MKSVMFKSEEAKAKVSAWFEKFRARLDVPTRSVVVKTSLGETHVLVGGPANGPPLVVLHGAMASSAHALVELAPLLKTFRVHAVDVLGQSVKSADARPSVKNDEYGRWMVEVLDGLKLEKTHLIGISWGGFVSIRLAAVAPTRIERMVLLVPAGMVTGSNWEGFRRMGWPMARYLMSPTPERLQKFVSNLLTTMDDDWAPYLGDAFLSYNMNMTVPMLARPEELEALAAPVLVVAADDDVSFPGDKLLSRAAELFPKLAGTELIKDCRHSPPTTPEFRAWLTGKIEAFLLPA